MVAAAANGDDDISRDLFVLSSDTPLSHKLMSDKGVIEQPDLCRPPQQGVGETHLPGGQRRHIKFTEDEKAKKRTFQAFVRRFSFCLFGGVALVAPMLLMVLHRDRTTTLATTSGAVILFSIVVAAFTSATPEVAVGAVSAYAAVLVVFVGAALPAIK
jgi:hypothetical protein